jgi:hypothetical protein
MGSEFPSEFQQYLEQKNITKVDEELTKKHPIVTDMEQARKLSIRLKPPTEERKRRMSEDDIEIDVVS